MRWPTRRHASSRELIRLLLLVSLVLVVAALFVPRVLGDGHRRSPGRACDKTFHAYDDALRQSSRRPGIPTPLALAELIVDTDERNPRDHPAALISTSAIGLAGLGPMVSARCARNRAS